MKKLLFAFLLISTICASAQIKLSGKVVEKNTKLPLEFATIILTNPETNNIITGESTQ